MTINIKKRRRERERALRAIFQLDYHENDADLKRAVMAVAEGDAGFDEDNSQIAKQSDESDAMTKHTENNIQYAKLVCETAIEHQAAIDERISRYLRKDWAFDRIPEAEKAVLRVATVEMVYLSMPREIAINEAVELAKHYGGDNAQNYINGILHRMAIDLEGEKKAEKKADSEKDSPEITDDHEKHNDEPFESTESSGVNTTSNTGGWILNNNGKTNTAESNE